MKTQVIHLSPKGDYRITRAKQRPEWANLLDTKIGGQMHSFHLMQNPVFRIAKPVMGKWSPPRVKSWESLKADPMPDDDLDSDMSLMVVYGNHSFPLSPNPELDYEQRQQLQQAFDEEVEQKARNDQSNEEMSFGAARMAYMVFASVVFLVAMVVGVIMVDVRYGIFQ